MSTDSAPIQRVIGRPFLPGQSGNPGGKPKGSRNRLTGDFMRELSADFEAHGRTAIEECRQSDPAKYLSIIASLMPKDVQVSTRPFDSLSDDELIQAIAVLQHAVDAGITDVPLGATIEGEATRLLPAVPEAAGVPRGGEDAPRAAADGRKPARKDARRGR